MKVENEQDFEIYRLDRLKERKAELKDGYKTIIRSSKGMNFWFKWRLPCKGFIEVDIRTIEGYNKQTAGHYIMMDDVVELLKNISYEDLKRISHHF